MGFDVTSMTKAMLDGFKRLESQNGSVNVNDVAKRILGGQEVSNLTTIFNQFAMQDGNANLSEAEFQKAISTEDFLAIVRENTQKRQQEFLEAKDPSSGNRQDAVGTPRDQVVAEKGEFFANEVWDPMKNLANEALKYMQEHNGTTEGFSITGFPHGVKLLQIGPMTSYSDYSNDTMSIKDGQPQVTRQADFAQACVVFEYNGEKYKLFSDESTNNLEFLGNPSFDE